MMFQKLSLLPVIAVVIICQLLVLPIAVSAEDTMTSDSTTTITSTESISSEATATTSQPEQSAPEITAEAVSEEAPAPISNDETNLENLILFPEVIQDETPTPETIEPAEKISPVVSEIETPQPLVAVSAPTEPYQLPNNPLCVGLTGDLNGDGLLNEYDEEVMLQMAKGLEPLSACADLDEDGFIGPADISILTATYKVFMPAYGIVLEPTIGNPAALAKAGSSNNDCTLGDANGDNLIDYKDYGIFTEMIVGNIPGTLAADLDHDGFISPADSDQLQSLIIFAHKKSPAITDAERGNCNTPTVSITYSKDRGATTANTLVAKTGDVVQIKVTFSKPVTEFEAIFITVDNDLANEIYLRPQSPTEFIYDLTVPDRNIPVVTVSVKKIRGIFDQPMTITSGATFSILKAAGSQEKSYRRNFGGQVLCETVTYSDWSACTDGLQTRTIISQLPENCELAEEQLNILEQTCQLEQEPEIIAENPEIIEPIFEPAVEAQLLITYPEGTLLRAFNDVKIYIIQNNFKRHIQSLEELAKFYFGQTIHNVSPEILNRYQTLQ